MFLNEWNNITMDWVFMYANEDRSCFASVSLETGIRYYTELNNILDKCKASCDKYMSKSDINKLSLDAMKRIQSSITNMNSCANYLSYNAGMLISETDLIAVRNEINSANNSSKKRIIKSKINKLAKLRQKSESTKNYIAEIQSKIQQRQMGNRRFSDDSARYERVQLQGHGWRENDYRALRDYVNSPNVEIRDGQLYERVDRY